jgi:hypothetical protein
MQIAFSSTLSQAKQHIHRQYQQQQQQEMSLCTLLQKTFFSQVFLYLLCKKYVCVIHTVYMLFKKRIDKMFATDC